MFSIMVVEDDNNTRRLTADVLEENGYKAITAKNGIEALEIMDEKTYRPDYYGRYDA
jgi:CheY-like chemotaxis protein